MIYFIIALLLVTGTLIFGKYKKINSLLYYIFFVILWVMLAFRYGQGTDYFSYKRYFAAVKSFHDVIFRPAAMHAEIGFRLLCLVFKGNYELLVFAVSTFEMAMLHVFIKRYSGNKLFSLTLMYPTFYLIYYFSALRQGLVISLFLGVMFKKLTERKYVAYVILTLLAALFHSSAIIFIALPIFMKLPVKKIYRLLIIAIIGGLGIILYMKYIAFAPLSLFRSYWEGEISVLAVTARAVIFMCFYICFSRHKNTDELFEKEVKIFLFGYFVYFIVMGAPLIASRLMAYFSVMEIIIFPELLKGDERYKKTVMTAVLCIALVYTYKNIAVSVTQGDYKENTGVMAYPYISIFNKEDLWKYRYGNVRYE